MALDATGAEVVSRAQGQVALRLPETHFFITDMRAFKKACIIQGVSVRITPVSVSPPAKGSRAGTLEPTCLHSHQAQAFPAVRPRTGYYAALPGSSPGSEMGQ